MAFNQRDLTARLREASQQINAELLEFVSRDILDEVAAATDAANQEIDNSEATCETLLHITQAATIAGELLETARQLTAVQAVQTGSTLRDAAAAAGVSTNAINRWMAKDNEVASVPDNVWWTTAAQQRSADEEADAETGDFSTATVAGEHTAENHSAAPLSEETAPHVETNAPSSEGTNQQA